MNRRQKCGGRRSRSEQIPSTSTCGLTPSGLPCQLTRCCPVEPRFDVDGRYDYGDFSLGTKPPGNRHFIPRRAKLKSAGGRSISLYEKWRLMQYKTNCVLKKFLSNHSVNVSVLPPCVNYDLWKHPKWKAIYDQPLDEDPCPDCDVRFTADCDNSYVPKIAPASILIPTRWKKRRYLASIILIGLPQHITVAYIKETSDLIIVEYLDPAGPSGDKRGAEEVEMWMHNYFDATVQKPVKFYQAAKGINFQSDKNDVMCQTWIWYWVYFRLIRKVNSELLARHIYRLGCEKKSLEQIHKFNCWLADLHKLDFFTTESPSQTQIAIMHTPHRPLMKNNFSRHREMIDFEEPMCCSRSYPTDETTSSEYDDDEDDCVMEALGWSPSEYDNIAVDEMLTESS